MEEFIAGQRIEAAARLMLLEQLIMELLIAGRSTDRGRIGVAGTADHGTADRAGTKCSD
jgi:hypothetical protein